MVVIDTSTPRGKVAQDWINAYVTLNIDEISRRFPECYTHRTLPASIGLPDESKEKYLERLGTLLPSLTKSEVKVHDVIEGPERLVIRATNELSTIYGPQLIYEAIFTISFVEEDGKLKLSRCEEFIDSQEYNKFVAKIASVAAEGVPQAAA